MNIKEHDTKEFLQQDSLNRLEWQRICEALANEAILPETQEHLSNILPNFSAENRDWFLKITKEVQLALQAGKYVELLPIDTKSCLNSIKRSAILSGSQLYELLLLCKMSGSAVDFVKAERKADSRNYPKLMTLLEKTEALPHLLQSLIISIDSSGQVLSTASQELRSARQRAENARKKIVALSDQLLQKPHIKNALQDSMWVLRDGRITLPIRVDRRSDVVGIPRGVSNTGQTVFIEPQELSIAQSELDTVEAQVQIEENKVLRALSEDAAKYYDEISTNTDILIIYDEVQARAKFASLLAAISPEFIPLNSGKPRFNIIKARHPLFVLEKHECVANDLVLASSITEQAQRFIWILTGPNAGGKTVAMKTLGLIVIMAKCGLFVPADFAQIIDFENIFVELGDRQSREDDLSTFSGHLLHVKRVIDNATEKSLVLLDEGFVGTDPAVGMALARATLEHLADKKVTTVITTHFSNLKTLANEDSRFLNASMEFEAKQFRPTYKLINDIPGQSFALELAERLNFHLPTIEKARKYYGDEPHRVELLLAELQVKRSDIDKLHSEQTKLHSELEKKLSEIQLEYSQINDRRKSLFEFYHNKLQKRLNAFEHRLTIREKQFDKEKRTLLMEMSHDHIIDGSDENEHLETNLASKTLENISEKRENSLAEPAKVALAQNSNEKKSLTQKISSFADLNKVVISKNSQSKKFPENDLEEPQYAKKFTRKTTSRDLLDEAHESLTSFGESFSKLDVNAQKEIAKDFGISAPITEVQKVMSEVKTQNALLPASFWQQGMRLKCTKFSEIGEVLRTADSKGMIECKFGVLKIKLHYSDILRVDNEPKKANKPSSLQKSTTGGTAKGGTSGYDGSIEAVLPHSANTVDVRGCLVDEAIEKVELFIDRAYRIGESKVVIVHGHGTGKVKQAVRNWLQTSKYVLRYRFGTSGEGGDGATIVEV